MRAVPINNAYHLSIVWRCVMMLPMPHQRPFARVSLISLLFSLLSEPIVLISERIIYQFMVPHFLNI